MEGNGGRMEWRERIPQLMVMVMDGPSIASKRQEREREREEERKGHGNIKSRYCLPPLPSHLHCNLQQTVLNSHIGIIIYRKKM